MEPDLGGDVGGGLSGGTTGGLRETDVGGGLSGGMRSGTGTDVSGGMGGGVGERQRNAGAERGVGGKEHAASAGRDEHSPVGGDASLRDDNIKTD